ncbi:MFS transporter [Deinococcus cellulosilyticus]|uniref:Tetracycline resistance MFS efflux pump n=1 Tax=Deinococcus cellulosilyticus (strain DSM 18568 / NBRC 106333 / KACC 11606 / 5516J-15) TaxID=1223518 RepID=A0A511MWF9_DEIC1|nr:MFS transporter [Deinococcus cellulosilyticus]GEM44507.1 tetracycline resistance MFS efflux pump [Deinococcus cellulosilyticus NBRC 106333 = KACC 11606]
MSTRRQAAVSFIFVTLLIDMLGLGVLIPVMPQMVASLTHDPATASQSFGVLIGLYSLAQLLASPILGALSDRYGRKPVLLGSALLASFSYALAVFSPSLIWLFVARFLGGAAAASAGVANAYIADISTPETRARNFGMVGAAFSLGIIIGPALGGLLGQHDIRLPYIFAAGFAFLNFLYGLLVLPESHHRRSNGPIALQNLIPLRSLGVIGKYPGLTGLAWVNVLTALALQFMTSTWVLHGAARYGWGPGESGLALTVAGVLGIPVQTLLVSPVLKRFGTVRTVQVALVLGIVGYVLYGLSSLPWMFFASMPLSVLMGVGGPALQAQLASKVPPEAQGVVQGNMGGLNSLTGVVGPLMSTALFSHYATPSAQTSIPGIAFFSAALLLVFSWMLYSWLVTRPQPARQEQTSST